MSKIQIIDPETKKEIKRNGKPILKGKTQGALTKKGFCYIGNDSSNIANSLSLKSKIQFTDVSFHFEKRNFALQISYYDPTDLDNAILVLRSTPFKVYARRPNNKRPRKEFDDLNGEDVINSSPTKRTKTDQPIKFLSDIDEELEERRMEEESKLDEYLRGLDELILFKDLLPKREQRKAIECAIKMLVSESKIPTQEQLQPTTTYEDYGFVNNTEVFTKENEEPSTELDSLFTQFNDLERNNLDNFNLLSEKDF